jgi:hypothetical protein
MNVFGILIVTEKCCGVIGTNIISDRYYAEYAHADPEKGGGSMSVNGFFLPFHCMPGLRAGALNRLV